ncbi:unnamed protein product, partial [Brenthis ino]
MSTMATVNTLKLAFFKDISRNIQELNMCGISDLNKKTLISSMSKLKCLKTLNISYTNINILDFIEIYQACPSIKNITIDFIFTNNNQHKLAKKTLIQCQEVFRNIESVNFVGNVSNLLYSQLPCFILNKAKLKTLQYTITNCEMVTYENEECEESLHFDEFCLYFFDGLNPSRYYCFLLEMYLFTMLNFQDYEVIIIFKLDAPKSTIYATPIFKSFFSKHFDLNAECLLDFGVTLTGNACVMLWSKTVTQFDEAFYKNLLQKLKPLFPFSFKSSANTPVPLSYDWYCTIPTQENDLGSSFVNEVGFKRRRCVQPNFIINYDKQFQNKSQLQLSLHFNGKIKSGVTLSTNSDYLRKLTYLNLCGVVRYSSDFFNLLFRCCNQLITLNIEVPPICSCFASISRSIPLSQTLKNIRLMDKRIDFELMFSSMSQCNTLENVNICDMSSDTFNLSDPFIMFQKCNNLYCLYVYGSVTDTNQSKKLKIIKSAKTKSQKSHIRVNVFNNREFCHDPFVAVFKLNPIKPI